MEERGKDGVERGKDGGERGKDGEDREGLSGEEREIGGVKQRNDERDDIRTGEREMENNIM